ncbi:hypothetical protein GYB62_02305 [bacterium]|nr:hypothetical protein [bacterium]
MITTGSTLTSDGYRFMGSIKGRILSIVIVAAIGFATYIALNFMQARHQASQLEKIQNQHFPIQVQLQQAVFALKQTHAYLEEAVFTAEQSSLDRAQSVATQFLSTLDAAGRIEPDAAASFQEMAVSFNSYYSNSVFLANKLIEGTDSGDDLAQLGKSNLAAFEHLVARLEKQLGNETLAFTQGIDSVSERARKNVTTGALTGLMTTLLIVLVAWFLLQRVVGRIEHMVTSLKNIAEQKSDLSTRIQGENGDEMSGLENGFNTGIDQS